MLKKLSIAFVLTLLLTTVALGATAWTVANQSTVRWDAVTKLANDTPIPAGDTVAYRVFTKKDGVAGDGTQVTETAELQYTITFPDEGRWLVGIQSVRAPQANPTDLQRSIVVWSDNADPLLVPVPFGFIYYLTPAEPGGFGPK